MDSEPVIWGALGFAVSVLGLALGFLKFGTGHFASKETVERLVAEISRCGTRSEMERLWSELEKRASKEDMARLERELDRQRTRIHNIPGEMMVRLHQHEASNRYQQGRMPEDGG